MNGIRNVFRILTIIAFLTLPGSLLFAQGHHAEELNTFDLAFWFGILELPFLLLCIIYSFRTAIALKGGVFGKGMNYLAWGFLVMAIGHLAMQIHHIFKYDIFRDFFGLHIGSVLWFLALMVTWGLSAAGFISIYRVSKKG